MGVKIEDLRERVRPIAKRLSKNTGGSFCMVDVISAGLLFLEDLDDNEVSTLIQVARTSPEAGKKAKEILRRARARTKDSKQNQGRRASKGQ